MSLSRPSASVESGNCIGNWANLIDYWLQNKKVKRIYRDWTAAYMPLIYCTFVFASIMLMVDENRRPFAKQRTSTLVKGSL